MERSWFSSLAPRVLVVVGKGYQRERIKDIVLSECGAIAGQWIFTPEQLALTLCSAGSQELLGPTTRQEFFRLIFTNRAVLANFPELKKLKRQEGFFRRLDQAVMTCREVGAHDEEREVIESRLEQLELGSSALRLEVRGLASAWDSWLEAQNRFDSSKQTDAQLDYCWLMHG
jgi:hypothetical protein